MGNEFRHADVGASLSKAEWEAIGTHIFNSQATGDILYASSSTQLSRLGKGSDTQVLVLSSGIPAWGRVDMNGTELILDADGDTSITADTDDQIDFKMEGNDVFVFSRVGLLYSTRCQTGVQCPIYYFRKGRGTIGTPLAVENNDKLGEVNFQGYDAGVTPALIECALIRAEIDGTPGDDDMPTRLVFAVTPDAGSAAVEAMRINQDKGVKLAGAFGMAAVTPQAQQAHIVDADGQLADITTKFNTLLADLEGYGMLATV